MDLLERSMPDGTSQIFPDPRRYTAVQIEGRIWFKDCYLQENLILLEGLSQQLGNVPIYHLEPSIASTQDYARARQIALAKEMRTNEYEPPLETALQHRPLADDPTTRDVVFLSLDLCGSTALRAKNPEQFDKALMILFREMGTLVGQFNASIFETTGDGFIAVIDHPSFNSICDAAVDLGTSLPLLLRDAINPALIEASCSPLAVRVGADFGEVVFRSVSIPATGFSKIVLSSDALNRAVKIQETCAAGQFRIGESLYELTHFTWMDRATRVEFDGMALGDPDYAVYSIT